MTEGMLDRFQGCLIGGAVGDALGYAVEFLSEAQIFSRYGERGITEYDLTDGYALISDDTQMTLFTAEGLLKAEGGSCRESVWRCYLDWLKTQQGQRTVTPEYSEIAKEPRLNDERAPGGTCLNALHSGICGSVTAPLNKSKGCGGVMRVAPVGLYYRDGLDRACTLGAECAAITHGHPLGYTSAAVLAGAVQLIAIKEMPIKEAVLAALSMTELIYADKPHIDELGDIVRKAVKLAEEPPEDDLDAIRALGEGWVGEEALAVAVYCAVRHSDSFEDAIIAAANHEGDSDSTAAICGNLIGAHLGLSAIPERYLERLELKELTLSLAERLAKRQD